MTTITIQGVDAVLESGDSALIEQIYESLFFFVKDNGRLIPNNLAQTDGESVTFPVGLIHAVRSVLKENHPDKEVPVIWKTAPARPDLERLHGLQVKLYDIQMDAVQKLLRFPLGIMNAATGSGKGNMVAAICAAYPNVDIGVFTLNTDLAADLQARIQKVTGEPCGILTATQRTIARITVVSISWAWSHVHDKKFQQELARYKVIVVDECHGFGSVNRYNVLRKCVNATARYGLSATSLGRSDGSNTYVVANLGPVSVKIEYEKLAQAGAVAKGKVIFLKYEHTNPQHRVRYADLYSANISKNDARNQLVVNLVSKFDEGRFPCVIFAKSMSHLTALAKKLRPIFHEELAIVKGDTHPNQRADVYQKARDGKIKVILASKVMFTGVDIPSLQTIVCTDAGSSPIENSQKIGRGMRTFFCKENFIVYDIYDIWPHRSASGRPAMFENQAMLRSQVYKRIGIDVEFNK